MAWCGSAGPRFRVPPGQGDLPNERTCRHHARRGRYGVPTMNHQHYALASARSDATGTASVPAEVTYLLTFDGAERQVLQLAESQLLQCVRRDEHLVPTIRSLLARIDTDSQASGSLSDSSLCCHER
jgi:hypothetical protein